MDARKIDQIAIGIIILLIAGSYFFFISESRARLAAIKGDEAELAQVLASAGNLASDLDMAQKEIGSLQSDLEDFNSRLPGEKRIFEFLVEIDRLAKQNSIDLKTIRPGELRDGDLYSRIPIRISGSASFSSLYSFLYQLENVPRITVTENLRINKRQKGDVCDVEMDLAVFVGGKTI